LGERPNDELAKSKSKRSKKNFKKNII